MPSTRVTLIFAFSLATLSVLSQTNSDEIARLRTLLTTSEERTRQAEKIAQEYKAMAERERHESDRRLNLFVAYAIADKSQEIPDTELRKLLALQAFNFNKKNYGYIYKQEIFKALIGALAADKKIENFAVNAEAKAVTGNSEEIYFLSTENKLITSRKNGKTWEDKDLVQFEKNISAGAVNLSPSGHVLAICINNRSNTATKFINVYNTQNLNAEPKKIENIKGIVERLTIEDDGTTFFTVTNNGRSDSYRVDAGSAAMQFLGHVSLFDFNASAKQLLTLTNSGKIKLFDFEKNMSDSIDLPGNEKVTAMKLFPKNKGFVLGLENGTIKMFSNIKDGRRTALVSNASSIVKIAFNFSQSLLAIASADNSVRIWSTENLREYPMTIKSQSEPIKNIAFSEEGDKLIVTESIKDENSKKESSRISFWPVVMDDMARIMCSSISRNLTAEEWAIYIGDIPYEQACSETSRK
jgi:WD40 repeat protein